MTGSRWSKLLLLIKSSWWAFAILAVAASSVAISAAVTHGRGWDEFSKLAGVLLTVLFSLATLINSFSAERLKIIATAEIEQAKIAAINELERIKLEAARSLSFDIERYKRSWDEGLEARKNMLLAAVRFYHVLQDCAIGSYDRAAISDCRSKMIDAEIYRAWITDEAEALWGRYWQRGILISEELDDAADNELVRKMIWTDRVKDFGKLLRDLRTNLKEQSRSDVH